MSSDKGFCTDCGFRIESFEGLNCCPECKTTSVPCQDDWNVEAKINWHEMRILCIWAENYQREKMKDTKVVYSIAKRLQKQFPNLPPLTLAEEMGQISKEYGGNVKVNDPKLRQDIIEQTGQEPGLIE